MGTSTDAILYYGFELYSDDDYCGYTEEDIERFEKLYDEYYTWQPETRDVFGSHCHCDNRMYYVCAYNLKANRGYPEEVDMNQFSEENTIAMNKLLKDFCDEHEIKWQEPKWMLVSYWG